ncbi:hypothetical protein KI387_025620 [Taxus chinensis]|uniref:Uncharacterized protein n=1 Tax=Taxus chinensis TaxID=29808 RepID=A0AA38FUZ6_TAXCH|nr:hypothetical protein KI387_025620 [Taxus chinensis]
MFKRSVSATVKDDDDLENVTESFLRDHEFAEITWIPSHRKVVFTSIDRVPVDTPGDGLCAKIGIPARVRDIETAASAWFGNIFIGKDDTFQAEEDVDALCHVIEQIIISHVAIGGGFLNDEKNFTRYPVIGFNHRMQASGGCQGSHSIQENKLETCTPTKVLDKNETICTWDRRVQTTLGFDVELRVPMSLLWEAIKDLKKIRDLNPRSLCDVSGIFIRSIKKSKAYLGHVDDVVAFELKSYRPRKRGTPKWNEDVYEEIEQMVIEKYGGGLHWGKSGGYLFGGLTKKVVSFNKFLKVKDKFDVHGVFSNEWTNGLFGIGGDRVEELRAGCALDKMCKCREDKHCAPNKGYYCKEGKVWKNARVCRKIN